MSGSKKDKKMLYEYRCLPMNFYYSMLMVDTPGYEPTKERSVECDEQRSDERDEPRSDEQDESRSVEPQDQAVSRGKDKFQEFPRNQERHQKRTRHQNRSSGPSTQRVVSLEDSVLAPWQCPYCSDPSCDEGNCQSTFDHQDFHDASTFFTSTINTLVLNAKLERPLDSHAPQTASSYVYEDDDWGEQEQSYDHEHGTYGQEQDVWDTEDQDQDDEDQDDYQMEHEEVECNVTTMSDIGHITPCR